MRDKPGLTHDEQMMNMDVRRQWIEAISGDEAGLELDRVALLIAAEEYPNLNIAHYLARLDDLSSQVAGATDEQSDPRERIECLSSHFSEILGFRGNTNDYYDARNSFLNDVIDRRTGIPITLSVVYIEIARRVGLRFDGVGMPGHFIIKFNGGDLMDRSEVNPEIFIDPFNGGRLISIDDCHKIVRDVYGGRIDFRPTFLRTVSKREIISRMLLNLKGIYARAGDQHKTLKVIERLMVLDPQSEHEIRDRGLVFFALGRYSHALADLENYLDRTSEPEDADEIRKKIIEARQMLAQLN